MYKQIIMSFALVIIQVSVSHAELIGSWENNMDGWDNGAEFGWTAVFDGYSSIGATIGNTSLMVRNGSSNYWAMKSSLVAIGADLTHGKFRIDASFRVNEWPAGDVWAMLDSLAIRTSTDGVNWDWRQVNASYEASPGVWLSTGLLTVIDRNTGEILSDKTWGSWIGNSDRTYIWDLNTIGVGPEVTQYGIIVVISINTNQNISNAGKVYLDNARLVPELTACFPSPGDGAKSTASEVVLGWLPGIYAVSHDVYFGTDFNDVNDANTTVYNPDGVYKGRQSEPNYTAGSLDFGKTYFWRIDEVNGSAIYKGDVWSFTNLFFTMEPPEDSTRRLMSWNIEFLGAREPPRTQAQHDAIAQRILTFGASVLALQEITDPSVLDYIRGQMGSSWRIYYEAGNENALLYDLNKVQMLSTEVFSYLNSPPYSYYPGAWHRRPVSGVFRPVGMYTEPFRVIGVHCHWSDYDIKIQEGIWLRDKIIEFLQDPQEPHEIILLGDLNGGPGSAPHPQLQDGNYLYLLQKGNGNITSTDGVSQIDHCYVTQDAWNRLPVKFSFVVRPEYYEEMPEQFDETYSDHYPDFIDFKPDPTADFIDFAAFVAHWLETGCGFENNWCDRADLTLNGDVGLDDLKELAENWLVGL
jgi:endonuclease/exonuclease/phosphatase family metal-dependent hydrolase